ncbi:MAG TPA: RNA 2',3'-cyclic phosphodiesterase [Tenuifilaceae bacterium]|nr:RNA 2',3'-cyclic phosphodiesterase [Tenuifilaceae bacterium]
MKKERTFIAVGIKPEAKLLNCWHKLKQQHNLDFIKWVDEGMLHLTLRFLGEIPVDLVGDVSKVLSISLAGFNSFSLKVKELGSFGRPTPRVIWVGIEQNETLNNLKQTIDKALLPLGFDREKGLFMPHITLGRVNFIRNPRAFYDMTEKLQNYTFQESEIEEVTFYQSLLTPKGAIHKPIKNFLLLKG